MDNIDVNNSAGNPDIPGQSDAGTDTVVKSPEGSAGLTADTFDGGSFDPLKLDEKLLPAYKNMQGAFTKKTQELANERKKLEEIQKSLLKPPVDETEEINTALNGGDKQPDNVSQVKPEPTEEEKWLKNQIRAEASEIVKKEVASIRSILNPIIMEGADVKIKEMQQKFPDLLDYASEMSELVQNGVPLEKAYWAIKGPKAEAIGKQKAFEEMRAKKEETKITEPGPGSDTAKPGVYKNFIESYEAAKRQHGVR